MRMRMRMRMEMGMEDEDEDDEDDDDGDDDDDHDDDDDDDDDDDHDVDAADEISGCQSTFYMFRCVNSVCLRLGKAGKTQDASLAFTCFDACM